MRTTPLVLVLILIDTLGGTVPLPPALGLQTPSAMDGPNVLLAQVYYTAFRGDEFMVVDNDGSAAVDLAGWSVGDPTAGVTFPPNTTLGPGQSVVVAANGTAYRFDFLRAPDFTYGPGPGVPMVVTHGRPALADGGDGVLLWDAQGKTVDAFWYGRAVPRGEGWNGGAAPTVPRGTIATRGRHGGHFVDTNASGDWTGPEAPTPGQVRRAFRWFTSPGPIEAFAAPDASEGVLARAVGGAHRRVEVNAYAWSSPALTDLLLAALGRGVEVIVHVEGDVDGGPPGGAYLRALARAGARVDAMVTGPGGPGDRRYRLDHAKYVIIDNESVVLGSENFSDLGYPTAGRTGNRGWGLWIKDAPLASTLTAVAALDWDPRHRDIVPLDGYRGPWSEVSEGSTVMYPNPKPMPLVTAGGTMALVLAPDHSLDAVPNLLGEAQGTIDAEVYYVREYEDNPYLQALLGAARRGVTVRLLLDGSDDGPRPGNLLAVRYINGLAALEGLPLEARLTPRASPWVKVHNKGAIIDRRTSLVGSINWAHQSMALNREVAVVVNSTAVASYFGAFFEDDWGLAAEGRTIDLGGNRTAHPGEIVTVVASGLVPGDEVNWSLQGHRVASGYRFEVTFDAPGAYTIRATVTDAHGHHLAAATMVVVTPRPLLPDGPWPLALLALPVPNLLLLGWRRQGRGSKESKPR